MTPKNILTFFFCISFLNVWAQGDYPLRCQFETPKDKEALKRFEREIQALILKRRSTKEEKQWRFPVIFHIVHNGETVGEGANVTAAQVYSQIEVLNEDFNLNNADTANTNEDFKNIAAAVGITFVPARLSPEGEVLEEPGIHRYQSKIKGFSSDNINAEAKGHTLWNPAEYLNVWVVPPTGGFLGTAQFPAETGLAELAGELTTANTEGLAVNYTALGRFPENPFDTFYNRGRTLTHELGHWLALFHTWGPGNGGCFTDDFCEDTPNVSNPNYACPDAALSSCNNIRMHENYMDYTQDACMSLFTQNQKERMLAALEVGRFRSVLNSSLVAPDTVLIANFKQSEKRVCVGSEVSFEALVQSIGLEDSNTSYQWTFSGGMPNTSTEKKPTINYLERGDFSVQLIVENAGSSDTTFLEKAVSVFDSHETESLPTAIEANFEEGVFPPQNWLVEGTAWQLSPIGKQSKFSVYAPNYYQNLQGVAGKLRSPVVSVQKNPLTEISFEYAYATWRESNASDTLLVYYRTNCDAPFELLWEKSGGELANHKAFQNPFQPFQNALWEQVSIPLNTFSATALEVIWEVRGGFGNNLHIDNLSIKPFTGVVANYNVSEEWVCSGENVVFNDLSKSFSADTVQREWHFEGGTPNYSTEPSVTVSYPTPGTYNVRLVLRRADGLMREIITENQIKVVESNSIETAIKENFEGQIFLELTPLEGNWESVNIGAYDKSDKSIKTSVNGSLVSASLNASATPWVNIQFDYAIANAGINSLLSIKYSKDCGRPFQELWNGKGAALNTFAANTLHPLPNFLEWKKESLYLNTDSARKNLIVKLDFKGEGNTVFYLDNINIVPAKGIKSDFSVNQTTICANGNIVLKASPIIIETGQSVERFQWIFEGGSPETSTAASATVTYPTAGKFDVTLIAQSQAYADTLFIEDFITVIDTGSLATSLAENFEQSFTFKSEVWQAVPAKAWRVSKTAGGYGRSFFSIFANNEYFGRENFSSQIISPAIEMEGKSSIDLSFDYAYAIQEELSSDTLCVLYSTDCGVSFQEGGCFVNQELSTTSSNRKAFIPRSAEWKTKSISLDLLNLTEEKGNIRIAFESRSAANNAIYIDNVEVEPFSFNIPEVDFTRSLLEKDTLFILEDTLQLMDLSTNRPRAWQWKINGPKNYTFSEQSPFVVFDFPGVYTVSLTTSNPAGEKTITKEAFLQIESRIPVGLKEGEVVQWELFPNPSQGVIELAGIENSATARVFNVLGTLIFSRELSKNSRKIDLSNQPKGLYIIEVKNNREFFRKRVIIH